MTFVVIGALRVKLNENVYIAFGVSTSPAAVLNRLIGLLPSVINVDFSPRLVSIFI